MKWLASILGSVVVLIVLAALGWLAWQNFSTNHAMVKAQQQAGTATVAAGQARAGADAQRIIIAGEARQHLDIAVHQDNAHAIAAAPGADQPLDPRLIDAADRGLCRYQADAADPGCAGLRQPDPAVVSGADPVGGPAGP